MINLIQASIEAGSADERTDQIADETGKRALAIASAIRPDTGKAASPEQVLIGMDIAAQIARSREEAKGDRLRQAS